MPLESHPAHFFLSGREAGMVASYATLILAITDMLIWVSGEGAGDRFMPYVKRIQDGELGAVPAIIKI